MKMTTSNNCGSDRINFLVYFPWGVPVAIVQLINMELINSDELSQCRVAHFALLYGRYNEHMID